MKRVFWSIADNNNLKYFEYLKNSFKKFHPNEELVLFGEEKIRATNDPNIFYRAAPYFSKRLMEEGYDCVVKMDADQIIAGRLDHIWEGDFDIGVVFNSNPREDKIYPIRLLDINPLRYVNCGLIVMKSKKFVDHWWKLCTSEHFNHFQYKEKDLLNIMVHFGDYKVRFLDDESKFHGLASKGYWNMIELRGDKLVLPANQEWNTRDYEIAVLHYAGGNNPKKWDDMNIRFKPEVAKRLGELMK